jgi:drug/metabolite transporter (DMT)-like permease
MEISTKLFQKMINKKSINWSIVGLFAALLACDTAAQLFFKKGVVSLGEFPTDHWSTAFQYIQQIAQNPMAQMGVLMLIFAFLIWLAIISLIDLSKAHPITCLVFGTVALNSSWLFHEPFSTTQSAGVLLIMLGAYIASEHS